MKEQPSEARNSKSLIDLFFLLNNFEADSFDGQCYSMWFSIKPGTFREAGWLPEKVWFHSALKPVTVQAVIS